MPIGKKIAPAVAGIDKETSHRHRALAKQGGISDAADFLSKVEDIQIKLESGEVVTINPAKELKVPTDPISLQRELARAPAQLAFFSYQAERAHAEVRRLERAEEKTSGETSLTYRAWYKAEGASVTEDIIRSRVGIDSKVCAARDDLINARNLYGVLRATRDAVEHRVYVLRKLVGNDGNATSG